MDNGPSHRGHASRLKQVEIFFSVVRRKVVAPNDFTDLNQVHEHLAAFEHRHNATAQPFQWEFTTTDLDDPLARIERHTLHLASGPRTIRPAVRRGSTRPNYSKVQSLTKYHEMR